MTAIGATAGVAGGASGINAIIALRQQIIDKSQLLQQIHAPQPASANGSVGGSADGGFAGALQSALGAVNASQTRADQLSTAYDQGQITDVAKVMLARQEAGVGFEATLQVRNKLLSAYQDIIRMAV